MEAVQRRAVKAVSNLRSQTYHERLLELGLDTLEERRLRGDLLQAYRVFSGKDNVDPSTWFTTLGPEEGAVQAVTRRQTGYQNVETPLWDKEPRRYFWSVRVCDPWNNLPDGVKKAESINCFKNAIDNLNGWGGQKPRR